MKIHVIAFENRTEELQLLFRRYSVNISRAEIMQLHMPNGCGDHACEAWETKPPAKIEDLSSEAAETVRQLYAADFAAFGYSTDPGKYRLPPSGGAGYTQGGHMLEAGFAEQLQLVPQQRCNTHNWTLPVVHSSQDDDDVDDDDEPEGECTGYGDDDFSVNYGDIPEVDDDFANWQNENNAA